jgi:hypothetical protein
LALIGGQPRVFGLGHRGPKNVQTADVLVPRRLAAEGLIQTLGISSGELRNTAHVEDFKIAQHGGAYRD